MTKTSDAPKSVESVRTVFGVNSKVELENGRSIQIPKWGVLKIISLGETISAIVGDFMDVLQSEGLEADGEVEVKKILELLPHVLKRSANKLAELVESGTTLPGSVVQITKEEVLGTSEDESVHCTIDDFLDILSAMIEKNLSEKTVGKFKSLMARGMDRISPQKR